MRIWLLAISFGLALAPITPAAEQPIADFSLADYHGKTVALADFKDKSILVVAFVGTECPLAKLYGARLEELASGCGSFDAAAP